MAKTAIGIDLGGTTIKGAVMTDGGPCELVTRVPTEGNLGGKRILDNIIGLIDSLIKNSGKKPSDFIGVGVGTPGFVDRDGNVIDGGANLPGWTGSQIYAPIKERFNLGATAANDVTAVALAELKFGAGRGVNNIVCFALGTGVGGGIVTNGRLYKGTYGMAGELGHISVETGGLPCPCGQKGCVERYASATGIVNLAVEYSKTAKENEVTEFVDKVRKNPAGITSKIVYEYVAQADPVALKVHRKACEMLGRAVGIAMNTLSPDRVVLGGGVMMAGDVILEAVKASAAKHCWQAIFDRCEIVPAQMGEDAGVMGALALAFEEFGG
jgi:glucokinase